MFYVYVLRDPKSDKLYVGYSSDLRKRIKTHHTKGVKTTKHRDYGLIYYEAYIHRQDALGREKFLKGGSGRKYLNKQLKNYFESSTNSKA